ncbi:hypothetical protein AA958_17540 [Streptomyces sp. CNQ-509]|uniref:hypothetical protein n=1 Tax=unclassified Streptomyces TaxID=2593676 RepID=UPI00062DF60F|nr:hypothetical protein [Streptomyces sp. CNQ-509]AKH83709.1 hypothetical protein AA958_17540 [Streptomyces sp. CNQ-509]
MHRGTDRTIAPATRFRLDGPLLQGGTQRLHLLRGEAAGDELIVIEAVDGRQRLGQHRGLEALIALLGAGERCVLV